MCTSLHIKGFRCFRDLRIDRLARINLIGGRNNTGKTALLEAICVHAASVYAPNVLLALYQLRGLPYQHTLPHLGFHDLFSSGVEPREIRTVVGSVSGQRSTLVVKASRASRLDVPLIRTKCRSQAQSGPPQARVDICWTWIWSWPRMIRTLYWLRPGGGAPS